MTKFRAHGEDELPNLELRPDKDAAFLTAVNRLSEEAIIGQHPQRIIIEEVREAHLSDFFDFGDLVSVMRERMADKLGNDDVFTESNIALLRAKDDGYIAAALDDIEANSDVRIDGFVVVNRWIVDRWWIKETDEHA